MSTPVLPSPYPYFGGKGTVVAQIWAALGDVPNYVSPFFGSGADLLARPHAPGIETVNDLDGHIINFWRAVRADPDGLAAACDVPVHEIEQHAYHLWLVEPERRAAFTERLMVDVDFYDLLRAARWVYGMGTWIGRGWCSGQGPWMVEGDALVQRPAPGNGIFRPRPHLGNPGQGIFRGAHRQNLRAYFRALQDRVRTVRATCGDWQRVLTPAVTTGRWLTGVLLDPPYPHADRDSNLYVKDMECFTAVAAWALAHGDDPLFRIVLCGYEGTVTMPASWQAIPWKANGGMGNHGSGRGKANARREMLWCSPHFLGVPQQQTLW